MYISIDTIYNLVNIPRVSAKEIANKLTLVGLEIESIKNLENDTILELKITPNRPDALSHAGVSRELSAIYQTGTRFKVPLVTESETSIHEICNIDILEPGACPRYAGRIIKDVNITDSPSWLKKKLLDLNIKPFNNIIDAINWTMVEYGHPLNVFDFNKICGSQNKNLNLKIRFAKDEEFILTQENKIFYLKRQDLVLTNEEKILSIAGITNGTSGQIDKFSKNLFLESAYFDPITIRKTAKRLQIITESSYRFERGMDPNAVCLALDRASNLILELAGGKICKDTIDIYRNPIKLKEIDLRLDRLAKLTNLPKKEIELGKIKSRFSYLGIETISTNDNVLKLKVPSFRVDIFDEIDLIEEVVRLIGFEKIPLATGFDGFNNFSQINKIFNNLEKTLRNFFINHGFFEVINYSFTAENESLIRIKNPLGEEFSGLRTNLFSGLIRNFEYNLSQKNNCSNLFEIGTVFSKMNPNGLNVNIHKLSPKNLGADAYFLEEIYLSGLTQKTEFYDIKGILESLFCLLKLKVDFLPSKTETQWIHPTQSADLLIKNSVIGKFGQIHPSLSDSKKISLFEINMQAIEHFLIKKIQYKPFSKFPTIRRDLSLIINDEIPGSNVLDIIKKFKPIVALLEKIEIVDVYQGGNILPEKKSITISIILRNKIRTLKEEEVDQLINQLIILLERKYGIYIRQ